MTRTRNAKTPAKPASEDSLHELFGGDDDSSRVAFDDVDWSSFGRLVNTVTARGALVSLYIASDSNTLCLSIGIGDKRKRYQCDDCEQFDSLVNGLGLKLGVKRTLDP